MQRRVEGGVGHVGQRPGGTVAGEGTAHGAAIAEEENVGGLEEAGAHGLGLSASGFGFGAGAACLCDIILHWTELKEEESGPALAVFNATLQSRDQAVVRPNGVVGQTGVSGEKGEPVIARSALIGGPPTPQAPVGKELGAVIKLRITGGSCEHWTRPPRLVSGQVCAERLDLERSVAEGVAKIILVPVEAAFEMPVGRPREPVSGCGRVVGVVDELGPFETVAGLVSFGPIFVPGEVEGLLRGIVQVGAEFAPPVFGVGGAHDLAVGEKVGHSV